MSKVIKVTDDEVFVGTDGGQIVKIEKNKMTWFASVGDEVDVFTSNEETIIVKKENKKSSTIQIVDSKRPVNKLAYVLLALFFGGIGIHKFFAGNTGTGILYLLFCWTLVPGIIAFIEALVACGMQADKNGNIYF